MDWLPAIIAGVAAAVFGWLAAGWQHYLYGEDEFRWNRARRIRLLAFRFGLRGAAGAVSFAALRPGHYEAGAAAATAAVAVAVILLASTDFERKRIPNSISYPALLAAGAVCWIWPDRSIAEIWLGAGIGLGVAALLTLGGVPVGLAMRVGHTASCVTPSISRT